MSTEPVPSALEEALMAIDTSIGTLVMARTIVERALVAEQAAGQEPQTDPLATMGPDREYEGPCRHEGERTPLPAMGGTALELCADCGESVEP